MTCKPVQQVLKEPPPLIGGWYVREEHPEGIGKEDARVAVQLDQAVQDIWSVLKESS